jgi:glycosyltransferase involved in cell wall biosynthesis
MGPSVNKALLDALLAWKTAWWLVFRGRWDLVHVHEEAAFWLALFRPLYKGPVLYDMHSSLVEQMENFGHGSSTWLRRITAFLERLALRRANGVIVICQELVDQVGRLAPDVPLQLIENLPVTWDQPAPSDGAVERLRQRLGLHGCRVALYTGTFGKNQGLELAIEAMEQVRRTLPEARLVLVGGSGPDLERIEAFAAHGGRESGVVFAGSRPPSEMTSFMALADVLLSPRTTGTNTPLKIYTYLAAGKPIVATDLWTHRQVLSDDTALLVPPRSEALATALLRVLQDPSEAARLAEAARTLAAERFGVNRYDRQLSDILDRTRAAARTGV